MAKVWSKRFDNALDPFIENFNASIGFDKKLILEEFLDTGTGSLSKKYSSQQINPDTLETNSQKLEYEDEFLNMGSDDYWILNSRTIKYLNQNREEETQKFVFEDLCLLN